MPTGRYAPSPSGDLHIGNLRTALAAWLFAAHDGCALRLRIDDLDPNATEPQHERRQLADLAALEIEFTGPVLRQSDRFDHYDETISTLVDAALTYPCFCSRREVREAALAPHEHLPEGAYPGTCRALTAEQRALRATERPAALRVRAESAEVEYVDRVHGPVRVVVDDFVVRRNDGVPSYNLATVVDDHTQEVGEVVRGADLLEGTGRQIWLRDVLGLPQVDHAHVPLVLNSEGERLAKRDGAVTLAELSAAGISVLEVRAALARSFDLAGADEVPSMPEILERFDPSVLATEPTIWSGDLLRR